MKPYIIEYITNPSYAAVLIGTSYESPVRYLDIISEDLKQNSINGYNGPMKLDTKIAKDNGMM